MGNREWGTGNGERGIEIRRVGNDHRPYYIYKIRRVGNDHRPYYIYKALVMLIRINFAALKCWLRTWQNFSGIKNNKLLGSTISQGRRWCWPDRCSIEIACGSAML